MRGYLVSTWLRLRRRGKFVPGSFTVVFIPMARFCDRDFGSAVLWRFMNHRTDISQQVLAILQEVEDESSKRASDDARWKEKRHLILAFRVSLRISGKARVRLVLSPIRTPEAESFRIEVASRGRCLKPQFVDIYPSTEFQLLPYATDLSHVRTISDSVTISSASPSSALSIPLHPVLSLDTCPRL